jgi:two-component system, LytTR family, sensor kinase
MQVAPASRPGAKASRRGLFMAGLLAVGVLLGLIDAAQVYLRASLLGRPYSWAMSLLDGLPSWILLALLAPAVIAMARTVRLDRVPRAGAIAMHMGAAIAFAIVHQAAVASITAWRFADANFTPVIWKLLTFYFLIDFLIYWAIVGVCYAIEYGRELRQRELAASQLQASLSQARLQALRAQLNPHFLFNTLNATTVLALKGEGEAVAHTLTLLSELLRLSLDSSLPQEIPLERELQFMDRYLEIQQVRFPDRLSVDRQIDPAVLDALVPALLLQPLVENAVMHGVAAQRGHGEISIRAARANGRLVLRVHDSGPGFDTGDLVEGIGLKNTRARLEQLYASAQRFSYGNDEGGAWVAIELPFREYVAPEDSDEAPESAEQASEEDGWVVRSAH